jgi:hypothetical protein
VVCLVLIATGAFADTILAPTMGNSKGQNTDITQPSFYRIQQPTPQNLKLFLAEEVSKYGGQYGVLLKVLECESSLNTTARNPKSTASGVAQFLDSTWNKYCKGDKDNPYDQIHCFVIAWAEGYERWWNESKPCWKGIK